MLKFIDSILDRITMYRLVVYELLFLLAAAGVLGAFHILPFSPIFLAFSTAFIFVISWAVNRVFSHFFEAPYNPESTWITALILALIVAPPSAWLDWQYLPLAGWAAAWAVASKFIFAVHKKHLFNPAALGVAMTSLFLGLSATWWVGTPLMVPFVLAGGLLIVRKIRRFDLWLSFMGVFFFGIVFFALDNELNIFKALSQSFLYAPAFFFATVMLTEPMTTPPSRWLRVLYGGFIGFLFLPAVSIGTFYFTPELALLLGNVFTYLVSPKYKLTLRLKEAVRLSPDIYEFAFAAEGPVSFKPGQYMEWTLPHKGQDSRGARRYFTLASSPTERDLRLGVKFYNAPSTFKRALAELRRGETIVASQLAGDFTLPRDPNRKLAFIAGGIGITPFRSMAQYLLDKKERRDIVLLYSNKTLQDAVYAEVFEKARAFGLRTVYAFTGVRDLPRGTRGKLDARAIQEEVPDWRERTFYISGPQAMVASLRELLLDMGVSRARIKTDYFPGLA